MKNPEYKLSVLKTRLESADSSWQQKVEGSIKHLQTVTQTKAHKPSSYVKCTKYTMVRAEAPGDLNKTNLVVGNMMPIIRPTYKIGCYRPACRLTPGKFNAGQRAFTKTKQRRRQTSFISSTARHLSTFRHQRLPESHTHNTLQASTPRPRPGPRRHFSLGQSITTHAG